MNTKHLFTALFLTLLLSICLCQPAAAFSSQPASWATEQCKHLEDAGILRDDSTVNHQNPAEPINRWYFCQILVDVVQKTGDWSQLSNVKPVTQGYFADLQSSVEYPLANNASIDFAMRYGAAYGITEGSSQNGKRIADAKSLLTREQAAKMMCALVDALDKYAGVPAPQAGASKTFVDQSAISSWATEHVSRASALGILQGDSTGKFNPKGNLTWQEACVMIDRTFSMAEEAVKAKNKEHGIRSMATTLDLDSDYINLDSSDKVYLLQNGSVLIISDNGTSLSVESYGPDGSSSSVKKIPLELTTCGGFCEGADAYYLAFGQSNMEENNSKEVYRLVKYDKNWNRIDAAAISNCYTTIPFHATDHTALIEGNGTLILHTARQRYLTRDDGLRHQSNFTAKVRTSDMSVTYVAEDFSKLNYTSHSFAQYAAFDGSTPVYVDHGDAYPRGFNLSVENGRGSGRQQNFFSFSGATGDNTTNAIGGGLGVSGSNYLFAGASSFQQGNDSLKKANVFLSVIPKTGGQAQIKWLTSLPADGSEYPGGVRLAQVNNNTFVVMWQTIKPADSGFYTFGDFTYAVFDGQGNQIGQTKTCPGYALPAADPIVQDGHVRWARVELDRSGILVLQKTRYINLFDLDIQSNSPTNQTSSPSTPGNPNIPSNSGASGAGTDNADVKLKYMPSNLSIQVGEVKELFAYLYGASGSVNITSSNPNAAMVEGTALTGLDVGTTTITATVTLNGKITGYGECKVVVTAAEENSNMAPSTTPDTPPSSTSFPTTKCEVNGLNITRTDVGDGETSSYYREDWDGNWLEVSVAGNTLKFFGCVKDNHSSAVLAAGSINTQCFVTPGSPFSVSGQLGAGDLTGKAISVGTRGDGEMAYTTFRSGVSLKLTQDGSGHPTLQVSLPFWLR